MKRWDWWKKRIPYFFASILKALGQKITKGGQGCL